MLKVLLQRFVIENTPTMVFVLTFTMMYPFFSSFFPKNADVSIFVEIQG